MPVGRALAPKIQAKLSQYIGGLGRSISQLLLGPFASKFFLDVPETHRNISGSVAGVDTPAGRLTVPNNMAKVRKYIWGWGGHYLSFY